VLKKLSLIISTLYTLTLTAFSLIHLKAVVVDLPSFNDKLAHTLAHFIFVILWFVALHYKLKFKYNRAIVVVSLFSFVYGVLIELLQGWITVSRQSDFKDVFANLLGTIIAIIVLLCVKKHVLKNKNTLLF